MITIQTGMLVLLGFLLAVLLGLLLAPAFWSRAVRLTTRRLKQTMPLSEMEIEADRDRIRAEYAIKMHKLEMLVEQVKMAGARRQIDINRRDARVNFLEGEFERLKASYEEAQNARRVLEQTISDRLPRIEGRLTEAKTLLHARERVIEGLTLTTERQKRALREADQTRLKQSAEIDTLAAASRRSGRSRDRGADRTETEIALGKEVDTLRGKIREQALLIDRVQSLTGRPAGGSLASVASLGDNRKPAAADDGPAANETAHLERELRSVRARNDDQAGEIARLKAAIDVFESQSDAAGSAGGRESRVALKARAQSLEAQVAQQADVVAKLRSELAAANERLARQASHYTGELRRLGGQTVSGVAKGPKSAVESTVGPDVGDRIVVLASGTPEAKAEMATVDLAKPELAMADARLPDIAGDAGAAEPGAAVATATHAKTGDGDALPAKGERARSETPAAVRPRLLDRIAGLSRTS